MGIRIWKWPGKSHWLRYGRWWLLALVVSLAVVYVARRELYDALNSARLTLMGRSTVADRLAKYGAAARSRLHPHFEAAGVAYPPTRIVLAGFKQEKTLELYAMDTTGSLRYICSYPVLAASGRLGPKLVEGDRQVPEGLYDIEFLNPNSRYHLSLRLNYPNSFDRARAEEDGRTSLGSDIMIHGENVSIGCLAIGNPAVEELFVLVADIGLPNATVQLSPVDLRRTHLPADFSPPRPWVAGLHDQVRQALSSLPLPPK